MGIVFGKIDVAEPTYNVILNKLPPSFPYEIRRYGTRYAVETEYVGEKNAGKAFMALAGYIGVTSSPQNEGETSISMTAPVSTEEGKISGSLRGKAISMTAPVSEKDVGGDDDHMRTMQFYLPAEYDDMSKIPKPTNPSVKIEEVPPAVGAVHRFRGRVDNKKAEDVVKSIVKQINDDGASMKEEDALDEFLLWQYNPPFTIPILRRNEVFVPLTEKEVDAILEKFKKSKEESLD